jgi:phospholipid/cholesterol/gamma-HCH transport system substrate-binding protein
MLTRTVRIQIALFLVIALGGIVYVGVRYVGLQRYFGGADYTVKAEFTDAGGIFTNAEVTYRGVPVGRVGDMRLTKDGIEVDLDITSSTKIPTNAEAVVTDRSVIGEQYVDLRPRTKSGPYLANGSHIAVADTQLPPPVQQLLLSSDKLVASVPIGALQTMVNELYDATRGAGTELQQLLVASKQFFAAATVNLPSTISLLDNSQTVLATQQREAGAITTFSANLSRIGDQLRASNGDISKVISDGAGAADQVGGLISDVHGTLGALLNDLLTTSAVFLQEKDGLREVLSQLPTAVTIGGTVITPHGLNLGLVPTFFDPLPCTSGYSATIERGALDTSSGAPFNTSAGCTSPPSTGKDVRGSQNAP